MYYTYFSISCAGETVREFPLVDGTRIKLGSGVIFDSDRKFVLGLSWYGWFYLKGSSEFNEYYAEIKKNEGWIPACRAWKEQPAREEAERLVWLEDMEKKRILEEKDRKERERIIEEARVKKRKDDFIEAVRSASTPEEKKIVLSRSSYRPEIVDMFGESSEEVKLWDEQDSWRGSDWGSDPDGSYWGH